MTTAPTTAELGAWGEALVAAWLRSRGWHIHAQQWHCRWGELDLVATARDASGFPQIAFVEVKTRSQGNWDADGLMAITRSKQAKLWKAAQLFLVKQPQWAEAACRFDVALVSCYRGIPSDSADARCKALPDGRYLYLQDYLENAFQL